MKFRSAMFGFIGVFCVLLCSCEFETTTSIILKPSQFDFGFVGQWHMPLGETGEQGTDLRIEPNAKTKGLYDVYQAPDDKKPWIQFTACQLDSTNTALVELDASGESRLEGQGKFYYFFASVEKGVLTIEQIDDEKLIALLKTTKTNSVIDRGILSTEITADPDVLRKLIIENRKKIISKDTINLSKINSTK